MKRLLHSTVVLTLLCAATPAMAGDARWLDLSPSERMLVDRVAADLFEAERRQNRGASDSLQARERAGDAASDAEWRAIAESWYRTQTGTRDFSDLTAAAKAPFRRRAMDFLGAESTPYNVRAGQALTAGRRRQI